jgi:hypothetical protein
LSSSDDDLPLVK